MVVLSNLLVMCMFFELFQCKLSNDVDHNYSNNELIHKNDHKKKVNDNNNNNDIDFINNINQPRHGYGKTVTNTNNNDDENEHHLKHKRKHKEVLHEKTSSVKTQNKYFSINNLNILFTKSIIIKNCIIPEIDITYTHIKNIFGLYKVDYVKRCRFISKISIVKNTTFDDYWEINNSWELDKNISNIEKIWIKLMIS